LPKFDLTKLFTPFKDYRLYINLKRSSLFGPGIINTTFRPDETPGSDRLNVPAGSPENGTIIIPVDKIERKSFIKLLRKIEDVDRFGDELVRDPVNIHTDSYTEKRLDEREKELVKFKKKYLRVQLLTHNSNFNLAVKPRKELLTELGHIRYKRRGIININN
jgi:hypothetical protein